MINVEKGRYWDFGWQLIDGCTPCSPGCEHCWSAAMTHRYRNEYPGQMTTLYGKFNSVIIERPERLSTPLKRKKPAVYAIWNDWAHEAVYHDFRQQIISVVEACPQHTFLALTKRPGIALGFYQWMKEIKDFKFPGNFWNGLTVCNQQEADEKIPIFLQAPGKKFLSIEPCLGDINLHLSDVVDNSGNTWGVRHNFINSVILGGETGPKARPMHPDWVRSIRDQCQGAGVPFFFKGWGEYILWEEIPSRLADGRKHINVKGGEKYRSVGDYARVGKKNAGRMLDGRTHDDLPWVKP